MQAPKCKLCCEHHWSPICPNVKGKAVKERVKAIEAAPVTKTATKKTAKKKSKRKKAKKAASAPST